MLQDTKLKAEKVEQNSLPDEALKCSAWEAWIDFNFQRECYLAVSGNQVLSCGALSLIPPKKHLKCPKSFILFKDIFFYPDNQERECLNFGWKKT